VKVGDTIYYQHDYGRTVTVDRRWITALVIGETSRSWITNSWPEKLPKNGKGFRYATPEQYAEDSWDEGNRDAIAKKVEYEVDTAMLRKIAELIG
jgi:hypothetical protein